MQIFCDFDGTISDKDSTDHVLTALAHADWGKIEDEWKAGLIGSGECMRRQIALIQASQAELDATLDQIGIDPGFASLVQFCRENNVPLTIVSDGVDYFINRILSNHGFKNIPIQTNKLNIEDNTYSLTSLHKICSSGSGVCKCKLVENSSRPRVFIGDGRSDFCVADKNDLVFAKGKLAIYCQENSIPYTSFTTLRDVVTVLLQYTSKSTVLELT